MKEKVFEIRKDITDIGITIYDIYEILKGDSEYIDSKWIYDEAVDYIHMNYGYEVDIIS